MRRTGTIGFVFLWLLTLVGGPLSRVARALPESLIAPGATSQCKMSHKPGKACCCGEGEAAAARTGDKLTATPVGCPCAFTEAPLPPVDGTPRIPLSQMVALPAPAFRSVPPISVLERVVSPHVGTLAPPARSRPRAPDVGRAPPVSF